MPPEGESAAQQSRGLDLDEAFVRIAGFIERLPGSRYLAPLLIFASVLAGYWLARPNPIDWYDHHLYLAEALLHGTFNVADTGIPDWFQDVVVVDDGKYLPYGPAPAILLTPFVAIWGTDFDQTRFSMVLGAVNAVLFWYTLGFLKVKPLSRVLGVAFFAFGTVHFYSATEGTIWFYNHVCAVFFLLTAIILFLKRVPLYLPAIALGFAWWSRGPTLLAAPFFLYGILARYDEGFSLKSLASLGFYTRLRGSKALRDGIVFACALVPFGVLMLLYNEARFGSPFGTGFQTVYESYTNGGLPYSFYRLDHPDTSHFPLFDPRNIPLHLYTLFLMPPQYFPDLSVFRPSPYGLSIFLTSPAFVYALFVKRRTWLKPASWIAIGLISIPLFMHYSQGWVQYGYRFLLDFMPFLVILTVLSFDDHPTPRSRALQIGLVALSIVAGLWGRYWANEYGW